MGLKDHQFGKLRFVCEVREARRRSTKGRVLKLVLGLASCVLALGLNWLLDWPLPRQNLAGAVWTLRGRSAKFAESENCFFKASKTSQDLMRPLISCEFCQGVEQVPRVSGLTSENFADMFAYSGQPVVVTDGAANWSAIDMFSFDFFKELYQPESLALRTVESKCQFFPYQTEFRHLGEVFLMDSDRTQLKGGSKPWYIGWSNCDMGAGNKLRQHYSKPYFLPEHSESSKTDWMFMGSPGYGAHMHVDNVRLASWQAQVTGHKLWKLQPPSECYFYCHSFDVTVHPGEIIVLDTNKWFHSTLVVGSDISITIGSEYD